MNQPSLDTLMFNVDSKYTLVVAAARRARDLMICTCFDDGRDIKPVSRALEEIAQGKIDFDYYREDNE